MATIARAVATLRFHGDDLEPSEVSAALQAAPTRAQCKGDHIPTKAAPGFRIAKFGMWRLEAKVTEPANLDRQVADLLSGLSGDLDAWRSLTSRYKADLFCGWFMQGTNEGEEVSSTTLFELGRRGIALSLDIYAPETDA